MAGVTGDAGFGSCRRRLGRCVALDATSPSDTLTGPVWISPRHARSLSLCSASEACTCVAIQDFFERSSLPSQPGALAAACDTCDTCGLGNRPGSQLWHGCHALWGCLTLPAGSVQERGRPCSHT
jgi:hypothetical protein